MAKRTASRAITVRAVPVRAPQPIIRVSAPRAAPHKKKKGGRRHHGGAGNPQKVMMGMVVGGFGLGMIDKHMAGNIPTIPLLGKAGTIALGCYFLGKSHPGGILMDIAKAAAAVAGYQFGFAGKVSGVDGDVMGIAAQV